LSTLSLARLLFAITAGTHFLFVSLTLGLAAMVAIM
jgi:cytochrome d ubiquinol oxidase subunit I